MTKQTDSQMTLAMLKKIVEEFIAERDWHQFHNAKSLSMAIAVEAAELMEHFLWVENKSPLPAATRSDIEHELVDILFAILAFANRYSIDIATAFLEKQKLRAEKYPAELARGRADKYHVYKEYIENKKKSNK